MFDGYNRQAESNEMSVLDSLTACEGMATLNTTHKNMPILPNAATIPGRGFTAGVAILRQFH